MKRTMCFVFALIFLFAFACHASIAENEEAIEREEEYIRKIQYKRSEADIFMDSLDDVMKEELVRSVLSENDEILLAKMLYGEDRENPMYMRAAIIWCVFNRMEASNKSISDMITPAIFPGYMEGNPVKDWAINIIRDVTIRYVLEMNGFENVGRVLPKEYLWYEQFEGHRDHAFKTTLKVSDPNCILWDWSLPSPYKE